MTGRLRTILEAIFMNRSDLSVVNCGWHLIANPLDGWYNPRITRVSQLVGVFMASSAPMPPVIRFGAFELDAESGELRKAGISLKIHPQPFRVLTLLAERPGQIVTREEIQHCLWGDNTFVDYERGINFCVNQIRGALGDDAESPRYVETLPRRGYRFVASVTLIAGAKRPLRISDVPFRQDTRDLAAGNGEALSSAHDIHVVPSRVPEVPGTVSSRGVKAGIVVLLAIAILTAGALLYFHRPPKLTERDTVVLADFSNTTGDPVFDDTLKQGLAVEFAQSPFLNVLSEQKIGDTLKLMGRSPDSRLTPEIARQLCQRAQSKAYFRGSIARLGNQYVVGLDAVNCQTGNSLAKEQVTANQKEQVLKALASAATTLRKKVGESLATVEKFDTPIAQATTPSLEALKAYSLGRTAVARDGDPAAGVLWFKQAIQLDPNFATAYAALANAYAKLGEETLATQNATKAYELREHVSEREKFLIEANYHYLVTGDLKTARQVHELWALTYPRDGAAAANLGAVYRLLGQTEKRLATNLKAFGLDQQDAASYSSIAESYLSLDRLEEARAELKEAEAKSLDSYRLRLASYNLAFVVNDAAGMAQQLNWAMNTAGVEDTFLNSEAATAAYYGQMEKARGLCHRAAESALQNDKREMAADYQISLSRTEADFGNRVRARQGIAASLSLANGYVEQIYAPAILARVGDSARAEKMASKLAADNPQDTIVNSMLLPVIRASIQIDRNDPAGAVKLLETVLPYELGDPDALHSAYLRGLAYLQLRQGSEAAVEFQKILDHRGIVLNDPIGALAHLQLARAYVLQSDTAKARAAYQDFLTLWKDADPDIPILLAAKSEYAKLN
jgi:DNA-binding winged helix-turn-helix (wHTH) protein/Flp pilus assembly protein TadD